MCMQVLNLLNLWCCIFPMTILFLVNRGSLKIPASSYPLSVAKKTESETLKPKLIPHLTEVIFLINYVFRNFSFNFPPFRNFLFNPNYNLSRGIYIIPQILFRDNRNFHSLRTVSTDIFVLFSSGFYQDRRTPTEMQHLISC